MKKNIAPLLVGIVFVFVGGGYLIASLLGYHPSIFFRGWWTLFLIIPAIVSMVQTRIHPGNVILLIVGGLLFCWCQGWLRHISTTLIFAVLLVAFGIYFVTRALMGGRDEQTQSSGTFRQEDGGGRWQYDSEANPHYSALFSVNENKSTAQDLYGATCNAAFGTLKVDLSDAVIRHNITVICNGVFGGVELRVPRGVKVVCKNLPIFGSVQMRGETLPPEANAPTVVFDCTAVFGYVTLR